MSINAIKKFVVLQRGVGSVGLRRAAIKIGDHRSSLDSKDFVSQEPKGALRLGCRESGGRSQGAVRQDPRID